jgi:hypothetical protein
MDGIRASLRALGRRRGKACRAGKHRFVVPLHIIAEARIQLPEEGFWGFQADNRQIGDWEKWGYFLLADDPPWSPLMPQEVLPPTVPITESCKLAKVCVT